MRKPLAGSRFVKSAIVSLITAYLRFTKWTNPPVESSDDYMLDQYRLDTGIYALWHGQHLLSITIPPRGYRFAAMFSRSADAEINAMVAERFGFEAIRGSGGRGGVQDPGKGGARALLAMKKLLDRGTIVCMIADIPHGTPREAGLGVVTLARISGRPVLPLAVATSRRKVLEKSWDRTTINLPFGRRCVITGDPIYVDRDCSAEELEAKRREVTDALNAATARAYELADGAPR